MADEKPKKTSKKWEKYELEGDTLKRKNRTCPKCGPGIFLAEHKDRYACGACGYMEKKSGAPAPEKPPEKKPEPKPKEEKPLEEPKEEAPKEEAPAEEAPKEEEKPQE